jgi:hypothetical protein
MNIRRFDELDDILMDDIPELGSEVQMPAGRTDRRYREEQDEEASGESDAYSVEFEEETEEQIDNHRLPPPASAPEPMRMSTSGDNQPSVSLTQPASRLTEVSNRYANLNLDENSNAGTSPASSIASDPSIAAMAAHPPAKDTRIGSTSTQESNESDPFVVNIGKNADNLIGILPQDGFPAAIESTRGRVETVMSTTSAVTAKKPNIYSRQLGANKALYSKVSFNNAPINNKSSKEPLTKEVPPALDGGMSGAAAAALDARQVEEVVRRVLQDERAREKERDEFFSEKAKESKPISYLRMGVYDEQRRAGPTGLFGAPLDAYVPFFDPDYDAAAALNLDYPDTVTAPVPSKTSDKQKSGNTSQPRAPAAAPVAPSRPPVSAAEAITCVVGDALQGIKEKSGAPCSPDSITHTQHFTSKQVPLKKSSMRAIDLREKAELIYAEFMKDLIGTNNRN